MFSQFKRRDSTRCDDRLRKSRKIDLALDGGGQRDVAPEWAALILPHRGHAFIPAFAGVRINGVADLRLACVF